MMRFTRQHFREFHRHDKGSALTEFLIVIPVFIILFSGLIKLSQVADVSMSNKVYASSKLWEKVYSAEDDSSRMTPRSGFFKSRGTTNMLGGGFGNAYFAAKGHWGESRANITAMPVLTGVTIQDNYLKRKITDQPRSILGDATVANGLTNDAIDFSDLQSLFGGGGGFNSTGEALTNALLRTTLNILGVTAGYAGNIRYDDVRIHQTNQRRIAGHNFSFSSSYQAGVSPALKPPRDIFTNAEKRAWVTARIVGEMENPYAGLMNVLDGNSLNGSRRYTVPRY